MVAYILLWFTHYFPIPIPLKQTNHVFQNYTKFDIRRSAMAQTCMYLVRPSEVLAPLHIPCNAIVKVKFACLLKGNLQLVDHS